MLEAAGAASGQFDKGFLFYALRGSTSPAEARSGGQTPACRQPRHEPEAARRQPRHEPEARSQAPARPAGEGRGFRLAAPDAREKIEGFVLCRARGGRQEAARQEAARQEGGGRRQPGRRGEAGEGRQEAARQEAARQAARHFLFVVWSWR